MRVAALYDVHGNLPALEAVLAEVRREGVDLVVVGGDVLPGPLGRETLALLLGLDLPTRFLHGNGESAVLAWRAGREDEVPAQAREVVRWQAGEIGDEEARELAGWPATLRVEIPGLGEVLFCHATPRSDTEIFTQSTPDAALASAFSGVDAPLVVCGHTHMPFDRTLKDTRIVNAGSVGMPFGEPGADWLLLGPGVEPRHTGYDLDAAAERTRASGFPGADRFADENVLHPPSAEAMLEAFSKVGLR